MSEREIKTEEVRRHFNELASSYDAVKKKNQYYYDSLKKVIGKVILPNQKVLDLGTGTGELLNFLKPSKGVGIDISANMIEQARSKFPHLNFVMASYEDFKTQDTFDFILLADVIEHLENPQTLFFNIKRFCHSNTKVVLTMANPLWEPFLDLLEKWDLKMVEGPHVRISHHQLVEYALEHEFRMVTDDNHILFPLYIPGLSGFCNSYLIKLPLIRHVALIKRLVFQPFSS